MAPRGFHSPSFTVVVVLESNDDGGEVVDVVEEDDDKTDFAPLFEMKFANFGFGQAK